MAKIDEKRERWNAAAARVLADIRKESEKSQEELAVLVGMSRSIIANIESSRKRIEVSDLMLICDALDFDPREAIQRIASRKSSR